MFDLYTNGNLSSFQAETLEELLNKYFDFYTIGYGSDVDVSQIRKITFGDEAEEIDFDSSEIEEEILEWRHVASRESFN